MSEEKSDPEFPHVLVIGCSFGGLGVTSTLVQCDAPSRAKITIVDAGNTLTVGGCWQYVWTGRCELEDTIWNLEDAKTLLPGVDVKLNTKVASLDVKKKKAQLEGGSLIAYDYLVIAAGTITDPSSIPGLEEGAINLASIGQVKKARADAAAFCDKVAAFAKSGEGDKPTFLQSIAATPYKCPPVPFEVIFLIDEMLRDRGVRESARLVVTSPVPWPFGGPPAKKTFMAAMKEKNIEYLGEHKLTEVKNNIAHFASGAQLKYDTHFSTFPQRVPDFLVETGLTNPLKLIPVNLTTNRALKYEGNDLFVVGDACHAMMDAMKKPHPKAGELAFQMGATVAGILDSMIKGDPDPPAPLRVGKCFAESGAGGSAIIIDANFSEAVANPKEGLVAFTATPNPGPEGERMKVAWVNGYITKFLGEGARPFSPKSTCK